MDFLIKPWDHQLKGIARAEEIPDLALLYEMGTGKTGTMVNIIRRHFAKAARVKRVLILGPVITIKNWQREFKMHSKIKESDVIALSGPGKRRLKHFQDRATDKATGTLTRGGIFLTNYEAMEMVDLFEQIYLWKPEIIVCDESQRMKDPKSKRARKVITLADRATNRYILTGTLILNSAMDVFNQFRILDGGKSFGKSFYDFRARYFDDENKGMPSHVHFPKWSPRSETYDDLNSKIYSKALRVLKKDCLDLPPLVRETVHVELGKEQERIYNEMKREYIAWVKESEHSPEPKAVVAQMALTKALRLQQIASGFAKTEDGQEIPIKDNPRLKALKELLQDLTPAHKVVVWATFKENYRQIAAVCEDLKLEYAELHGGVSTIEKNSAIDRFKTDDSCRVIIANAAAGGIGISLTAASYSVFFSRNFSLEQDLQAESRNHRGGSEIHSKITRIDIVASDTIDEIILEALAQKKAIGAHVIDGIIQQWTQEAS